MSKHGDLLAVLREQSETVSLLISLAATERRAIATRDLSALSSVKEQEYALSRRLRSLESRREEITCALRSPAADVCEPTTLREMLNGASRPEALQLKSVAETFPVQLTRLGDEHHIGGQFVLSALGLSVTGCVASRSGRTDTPR